METINDIIKEMRGRTSVLTHRINGSEGGFPSFDAVETDAFIVLADRLDAAYKRDLQAMVTAGECDMRTAMDEVARLREENERLTGALACVVGCADSTCGGMGICRTCPASQYFGGAK